MSDKTMIEGATVVNDTGKRNQHTALKDAHKITQKKKGKKRKKTKYKAKRTTPPKPKRRKKQKEKKHFFRNLKAGIKPLFNEYWPAWIREQLVKRLHKNGLHLEPKAVDCYWQPIWWVTVKLFIIAFLSNRFLSLKQTVAGYMMQGVNFFKLDQIYNFTLPDLAFYTRISGYLLWAIVIIYAGQLVFHQIQALFSSLIIDKKDRQLIYLQSVLIHRRIHLVAFSDITSMELKQNILQRLLNMGTAVIRKKDAEEYHIASLNKVRALLTTALSTSDPEN